MTVDTTPKKILDKLNAGIQERFASSYVFNYTFTGTGTVSLDYNVTIKRLIFKNTSASNKIRINFNNGNYNYTLAAGESVTVILDHPILYITGATDDSFCLIGVY